MLPGTLVGNKYIIEDELRDSGGMATVYVARHTTFENRQVAVKVFSGALKGEGPGRFRAEANRHSLLEHPNIVRVEDFGEHEGRPFLVMEFVVGKSLANVILEQASVSLTQKLRWVEQLCAAVAYAHTKQIIHRDIKPANVMVQWEAPDKPAKLLDFGIACFEGSQTAVTEAGTACYMAPEQHRAEAVPKSDLFALGVVLYELLTYRQAFPGRTYEEIRQRVLAGEPVPLREIDPTLDKEIVQIVERALKKDLAERYESAQVFAKDLERVRQRLEFPGKLDQTLPPISAEVRRRVADLIREAHQSLESGHPGAAAATCRKARELDEKHPDIPLLERDVAARVTRARDCVADAQRQFDAREVSDARRTCALALQADADLEDAKSLAERIEVVLARVGATVREARTHLGHAEPDLAERTIAEVRALDLTHPDVRTFDEELRERRGQVATLGGEARAQFDKADLNAARKACDQGLRLDKHFAPLVGLQQEIARSAADRAERAASLIREARRLLATDTTGSRKLLDDARKLAPDEPEVRRFAWEFHRARVVATLTESRSMLGRGWTGAVRWVETLASSVARSAPSRTKSGGGARRLPRRMVVLGGIGLAVLVSGAFLALRSRPTKEVADVTLPAAVPGILTVRATPWATITAITDEKGKTHPLPADPTTPALLSLPPGSYTITLTGPPPDSAQVQAHVRIESNGSSSVAQDFDLTVEEYFEPYLAEPAPAATPGTGQSPPDSPRMFEP